MRGLLQFAVAAACLGMSACDQINSVSTCDTMERRFLTGLLQAEMGQNLQDFDRDRLSRVAYVTDLKELSSGYNKRTCAGTIHMRDGSDSAYAVIEAQQTEGVKDWVDMRFTEESSPDISRLAHRLREAYLAEGR